MFFGINLQEILTFPFKDDQARKHLLVGSLVALSAFVIPILPYLALMGYAVSIARQILRGEEPRMVAWEDWSSLLSDGIKLFGVRMVYSIPIFLLVIPIILISTILPIFATTLDSREAEMFFVLFPLLVTGLICILIPLSIPLAILIPVAELHTVEKGEFAAAFQFKEWWSILRVNLSGFLAAFGVYYIASMLVAILIQILAATIILSCLLIVLIPASTIYLTLITYAVTAVAYREGKAKLAQVA
jgi:hypothetical protein